MALYPEIQRCAQEEIEKVIGNDRLPTWDDQPNLPYVCALIKEVLRVAPAAPLGKTSSGMNLEVSHYFVGLPHMSSQDDVYMGYRIPANVPIITNLWYDRAI